MNGHAASPLVEMARVSVMRELRLGLDEVSLTIQSGEHVAIIGPNGCGKSTLVKTLTRECYPLLREGSFIKLRGKERWNIFDLRAAMGIVSGDLMTSCTRDLTGLEIVLSGFFSSIGVPSHRTVNPLQIEAAHRALHALNCDYLADRSVLEMSSGEARRTVLARALVHQPPSLLLDEPSTALDLFAQHELRESLQHLATEKDMTLVLVTHHLPDIVPAIERVVLMKAGRVFADGPKDQILRSDVLTGLFGLPVEVERRGERYHVIG